MKTSKHKVENWTIRQFRDKNIDVLPISQRLPVREKDHKTKKTKEVEIIETLLDGCSINMITLMSLLNRKGRRILASNKFDWESIDGGHRKRAILSFLADDNLISVGSFILPMEPAHITSSSVPSSQTI